MELDLGPAVDVRPLFAVERAERTALVEGLPAEAWSLPTVCPGWDVHDVVAHLLNDHVRRLSGSRDGHAGAVFADDETLPAYLARVNEEFVVAMRQASPRVLLDHLTMLGDQLDLLWARADLAGPPALPVSWAGGGAAWLDIAREYTELWVHQQQIRDAVGRPGATDPALVHPVLDTFARALPYTLRHHKAPTGTVATLIATGTAGGRWDAVRDERCWRLVVGGGADPVTAVVLDQEDLLRLATRGISPEQARARAGITGDPTLAAAMTTLLAVVA